MNYGNIKLDTFLGYFVMEGDSPFAKKFNEEERNYWEQSGKAWESLELILTILIDDYNQRYGEQPQETVGEV